MKKFLIKKETIGCKNFSYYLLCVYDQETLKLIDFKVSKKDKFSPNEIKKFISRLINIYSFSFSSFYIYFDKLDLDFFKSCHMDKFLIEEFNIKNLKINIEFFALEDFVFGEDTRDHALLCIYWSLYELLPFSISMCHLEDVCNPTLTTLQNKKNLWNLLKKYGKIQKY
jgi:hypothetical protein